MPETRAEMIARLREEYSAPARVGVGTCAAGKTCTVHTEAAISYDDRITQWIGNWYHAACLPDEVFWRLASVNDIAPGIFDDVAPVAMNLWPLT